MSNDNLKKEIKEVIISTLELEDIKSFLAQAGITEEISKFQFHLLNAKNDKVYYSNVIMI